MKKLALGTILFFLFLSGAVSAQDCDFMVGTWDVTYDDSSTATWVITETTERDSSMFPCYTSGNSTSEGEDPVPFRIYPRVFAGTKYMYTEDLGDLDESMPASLFTFSGCTLTKYTGETPAYPIAQAIKQDCTDDGDDPVCPARTVLGEGDTRLDTLHRFRDEVLAENAVGKAIIKSYYDNARSMNDIIISHPALKSLTEVMINATLPVIEALLK